MQGLKPGDRVDCRVKEQIIVNPYNDFDCILTFEIVSAIEQGYYLFVPQYYAVRPTVVVNPSRCSALGIERKFIGENITHITDNLILAINRKMDGMCCSKCGDFILMGAPNQKDKTMICYSCRFNPYR